MYILTILWLRCISSFSVAAARAFLFRSESRPKPDRGSAACADPPLRLPTPTSASKLTPTGVCACSRLNGFSFFTISIARAPLSWQFWQPRAEEERQQVQRPGLNHTPMRLCSGVSVRAVSSPCPVYFTSSSPTPPRVYRRRLRCASVEECSQVYFASPTASPLYTPLSSF